MLHLALQNNYRKAAKASAPDNLPRNPKVLYQTVLKTEQNLYFICRKNFIEAESNTYNWIKYYQIRFYWTTYRQLSMRASVETTPIYTQELVERCGYALYIKLCPFRHLLWLAKIFLKATYLVISTIELTILSTTD